MPSLNTGKQLIRACVEGVLVAHPFDVSALSSAVWCTSFYLCSAFGAGFCLLWHTSIRGIARLLRSCLREHGAGLLSVYDTGWRA